VGKKKANLKPSDDLDRVGDQWVWTALDPDSKLVPHHLIGKREARDAIRFTKELARRVEGRVQINADKLNVYRQAIFAAWGRDVDFGRIVKRFAGEPLDTGRYSPPKVVGVEKEIVYGTPDIDAICTSHVERNNLTMRMHMRRFTRLTNGFSKKVENLRAAANLHFAYYNFCRKHSTIKTTPAIAAGVADRRWTIEELVELPYRPRTRSDAIEERMRPWLSHH
jgi:IS1 family transposase